MAEQTRAEDIEELRRYKKWLTSDERKTPKDKRDFVGRCLDNLENRLRGMAQKVAGKVMETLQNPRIKEQKKSEVKEHARKSVRALLEANRKLVEEQRAKVAETPAHKKQGARNWDKHECICSSERKCHCKAGGYAVWHQNQPEWAGLLSVS